MLVLIFEVADERYAVPARSVLEVVPRPETRGVPGAPPWVLGLFAREGAFVPVIDLVRLISFAPCPRGASSRVAIISRSRGSAVRSLGLLAPGMTRVVELGESAGHGLHVAGQEFLGTILRSGALDAQLVDVDRLLPPAVDALLFGAAASEGEERTP